MTIVPLPDSESSPLCEMKINATAITPTKMKKNGPEPFFVPVLAEDEDLDEPVAVADNLPEEVGVDEGVATPRVGTSGIEMVDPARAVLLLTALFLTALFLTALFAVDLFATFFTGRLEVFLTAFLATFLATFLAGRLAALVFLTAFLTGLLADFLAGFLADFLTDFLAVRFAATEMTPCNETAHVAIAPSP